MVEAHAGYLKKNPQRKAQIQGNTDAQGSREYNLALGQRRAESVKSMMRVLGVPENQLEAVSYGKENCAPPAAATRITPKPPCRRGLRRRISRRHASANLAEASCFGHFCRQIGVIGLYRGNLAALCRLFLRQRNGMLHKTLIDPSCALWRAL